MGTDPLPTFVGQRMKSFAWLGVVVLVWPMTSCADASSANPGVTAASVGASSTPSPAGTTLPPTTEARVMTSASCAFEFSPSTLAERAWAFDGTLVSFGVIEDSNLGQVPSATFAVNHWYRGGSGDQITVQFETGLMSESAPNAAAGARLLVAGESRWGGQPLDDPVAWGCGFTQPWTADAAASWTNALGA
jgi:hypothetical protein